MAYEAEARRGAALLTAKRPGWADRADPGTLNMSLHFGCVLAQEFQAEYGSALEVMFPDTDEDSREELAVEHGFHLPYLSVAELTDRRLRRRRGEWDQLTAAWRGLITQLRSARDGQADG